MNLSAGTYYVRVRDINNCTTSGSITLNQPVALDASITAQTNVVCFGGNTGSVTVVANPATGTAPYDYSINGGGSWFGSGTFSNLNASIYTVIARDANGCLKQVPVTITQLTQLNGIVTKTDVSCKGNNDGMITISSPSGGSGNYQYSVDGGEWKFFAPKDGVYDDREEAFEVKLGPLAAGLHFIAVRATDEDGNIGVEKVSVRGK